MPAREIIPFTAPDQDSIPFSQDTMIDEQSSASGHDYASDRRGWQAGFRGGSRKPVTHGVEDFGRKTEAHGMWVLSPGET